MGWYSGITADISSAEPGRRWAVERAKWNVVSTVGSRVGAGSRGQRRSRLQAARRPCSHRGSRCSGPHPQDRQRFEVIVISDGERFHAAGQLRAAGPIDPEDRRRVQEGGNCTAGVQGRGQCRRDQARRRDDPDRHGAGPIMPTPRPPRRSPGSGRRQPCP